MTVRVGLYVYNMVRCGGFEKMRRCEWYEIVITGNLKLEFDV